MSDETTPAFQGDGTLWNAPVLVVQQKAKLIELTNEYHVYDENGADLATVRQSGQSALKMIARLFTSFDQFLTHHLDVMHPDGSLQMRLTRPAKFMKSKILVSDASGNEMGRVVQENVVGKKRFSLQAQGVEYGKIRAENLRSWDFAIEDQSGQEVARIKKKWEGLLKAGFTTADNYIVRVHRPLQDPLRALVVASALAIDTALKQDAQGFN